MLYALIVLYNKNVYDSITYNFVKKYKNIRLIIFDNSDESFRLKNKDYCDSRDIIYYTLDKNIGLSKAYNYCINKIEKKGYIIILDDDTTLTDKYINEVFEIVEENIKSVCLPIIIANEQIISPVQVQFNCRIKIAKSLSTLNSRNISAINSGMLLKLKIFDDLVYNERLFLDYVDHDFMKQIRKNKIDITIMNSIIKQNYSRFQLNDINSELRRFKIYIKDFKIYCRECHNLLFFYLSTAKYRFYQFIKYKSFKFLFTK